MPIAETDGRIAVAVVGGGAGGPRARAEVPLQYSASGSRTTSRDFTYDGVEFEAGTNIDTELDVNTYIVDVMYRVYGSDRAEVLVGGGLHIFDFSTEIEARISVGDLERSGKSAAGSPAKPATAGLLCADAEVGVDSNDGVAESGV